jgi:Mg-chelatase subunit ChlD
MPRTFPHINVGSPGDLHFNAEQADKSPESLRTSSQRRDKLERYANFHTPSTHTVSLLLSEEIDTAVAIDPHASKAIDDADTTTDASVLASQGTHKETAGPDTIVVIPSSKSDIPLSESPYESQAALDYATQYAYTLHEIGHANYTNFAIESKILGELYEDRPPAVAQFAKYFFNALEDGAIEHRIRQNTTERAAARQKLLNHFIRIQEGGQHSWLSALSLAALDFTVYDTGIFGSLLDPANTNISFTNTRHRDEILDLLHPLYNLCGVVYHATDPETRYTVIKRFWQTHIAPRLDAAEDTDEQQTQQPPSQGPSQQPQDSDDSQKETESQGQTNTSPSGPDTDANNGDSEDATSDEPPQQESPQPENTTQPSSDAPSTGSEASNSDTHDEGSSGGTSQSHDLEGSSHAEDTANASSSSADNSDQEAPPDPTDTTASAESPFPDDIGRATQQEQANTTPSVDADDTPDIGDLPPPMSPPAVDDGATEESEHPQEESPAKGQDDEQTPPGSETPQADTKNTSPPATDTNSQSGPTSTQSHSDTSPQSDTPDNASPSPNQGTDTHDTSTGGTSNISDASNTSDTSDTSNTPNPPQEATTQEESGQEGTTEQSPAEGPDSQGESTREAKAESAQEDTQSGSTHGQLSLGDFASEPEDPEPTDEKQADTEQPVTPDNASQEVAESQPDTSEESTNTATSSHSRNSPITSPSQPPSPPTPKDETDAPQLPADQEEIDKRAAESQAKPPETTEQQKDLEAELEKLDDTMESLQEATDNSSQSGSRTLDTSRLTVLPDDNPQAYDTDKWNDAVSEAEYTGKQLKQALTRSRRDERSRGRTSGRYDTGRAAAHAIGKTTYFRQRDFGGRRKYALMIVLDRSGSMSGRDIDTTEQAVAQFALAAEDIGIDVCVLDVYDDRPRVLSPFNTDTETTASSLISGYTSGTTPLTDTLVLARERMRQESTRGLTPLMLVVTDGKPNNRETYLQELEATRQEIPSVLGITIDRNADKQSHTEAHREQRQLFTAHEFITSPSTDTITTALESLAIHAEPLQR